MHHLALLTTLLLPAALAVDMCAYPTVNCPDSSGAGVCCMNQHYNICCNLNPSSHGVSVQWFGLPTLAGGTGHSYSRSDCTGTSMGGVGPPGGCKSFSPSSYPKSIKWNYSSMGKKKRGSPAEECVEPNAVVFTDKNGVKHTVAIPDGRRKEVLKWAEEDDKEQLATLDDYSENNEEK